MKQVTVEYYSVKDKTTRDGRPFKAYSVKESGSENWYDLKGPGRESVQQGQTLLGTLEPREYNGKTYYTLNLVSEETKMLLKMIKELKERIDLLEMQNTLGGKVEDEVEEVDIPF